MKARFFGFYFNKRKSGKLRFHTVLLCISLDDSMKQALKTHLVISNAFFIANKNKNRSDLDSLLYKYIYKSIKREINHGIR